MESSSNYPPLIAIVGPTASGKTELAIGLAKKYNGEIVNADSRTIYKGMDIGTAKPTQAERRGTRYHLLDIVDPAADFTVADYKALAVTRITEIGKRGKLPLLVGGSGLYVDAVLFDFAFAGLADSELRSKLRTMSVEQLQRMLEDKGIGLPENTHNRRHLVRRLETSGLTVSPKPLRPNTLVIGLQVDKDLLAQKIANRLGAMFTAGLQGEAMALAARYGWENTAMQTIGYREFAPVRESAQSLSEIRERILRHTIAYAKRQRTWFSRNKSIHWIREREEAEDLITTFLSK